MSDVAIVVGDRIFRGWQTARVTRGIDSLSGSFELAVANRWISQETPWDIFEGDECSILVAGEVLLTGFVDTVSPSFSASDRSISVSGRDRASDLVDCSARLDRWEFSGVDVLGLAQKIARPFGVNVSLQPGLSTSTISIATKKKKHSIDPGDTAANALENVCRVPGLLPMSDGRGNVTLVQAGATRCPTDLVEGKNLLGGRSVFDNSNRYRNYFVLSSSSGFDTQWRDWANDESPDDSASVVERVTSVRGSAQDLNARSGRVLMIRPEGSLSAEQARARAQWEATVRAARGVTATVTVQGWTAGDGKPWPVNAIVRVRSPSVRLDGDMLIVRATHSLGPEGSTTQLDLTLKDAFKPQPTIPAGSGGLWSEISKGARPAVKL